VPREMLNNAYTQVYLVLTSGALGCRVYRRQEARMWRLSSRMHSARDAVHTDTHDFYYIAENEKKKREKNIEERERERYKREK